MILEVKILQFRPNIVGVPLLCNFAQKSLKNISRIPFIRSTIRIQNITEHAGHRTITHPPWHQLKRAGVWFGDHIAFLNPGEPLDGRSVKTHPFGHALFQFGWGYGKTLEHPQDISEPELDKTDISILYRLSYIIHCLAV